RRRDVRIARATKRAVEQAQVGVEIVDDQDACGKHRFGRDQWAPSALLGLEMFRSANASAAVRVFMNSPTLIGLVTYWKKPDRRPRSMPRGMALAVTATTGIWRVVGLRRKRTSASSPLISGRFISIKMTSGIIECASSKPNRPVI